MPNHLKMMISVIQEFQNLYLIHLEINSMLIHLTRIDLISLFIVRIQHLLTSLQINY